MELKRLLDIGFRAFGNEQWQHGRLKISRRRPRRQISKTSQEPEPARCGPL
jgi:hypothetical protein